MANSQAQGKIVQCIGAVVDVEFPRDQMPKVYDALKMEGSALTLEVQQQLGDGVVRTIAMGSTEIAQVAFGRGKCNSDCVSQIASPLAFYGVAVWGNFIGYLLNRSLSAANRAREIMIATIISVVLTIALDLVFLGPLQQAGLAELLGAVEVLLGELAVLLDLGLLPLVVQAVERAVDGGLAVIARRDLDEAEDRALEGPARRDRHAIRRSRAATAGLGAGRGLRPLSRRRRRGAATLRAFRDDRRDARRRREFVSRESTRPKARVRRRTVSRRRARRRA